MRKLRERALSCTSEATPMAACFELASPGLAPEENQPRRSKASIVRVHQSHVFARGWTTTTGARKRRPQPETAAGHAEQARAREEPSPGPPASETGARPPGHRNCGGAPRARSPRAGRRPRPRKCASLARGKFWPRTWI